MYHNQSKANEFLLQRVKQTIEQIKAMYQEVYRDETPKYNTGNIPLRQRDADSTNEQLRSN